MSEEPGWITKADAAALLDVDERTIERRARAGRINARARPGFPTRYWAADVEKLRQTTPQEVRTGILETVPAASTNGHGAVTHQRHAGSPIQALLLEVLQELRDARGPGPIGATGPTDAPTGPTAPTRPRVEDLPSYVPLDLATAYSGLSARYLRKMIRRGTVTAIRDAGQWKIHKPDVVALG